MSPRFRAACRPRRRETLPGPRGRPLRPTPPEDVRRNRGRTPRRSRAHVPRAIHARARSGVLRCDLGIARAQSPRPTRPRPLLSDVLGLGVSYGLVYSRSVRQRRSRGDSVVTKGVLMTMELGEVIQLGEPVEHQGTIIAPLFPRRQPRAEYATLEQALPLGFKVTEVDAAGSVPELLVSNPLEQNVLLYDGEELVGAKQNRILNVTVLVAARSETRIPVSCVEQGRWHAHSASFEPARHAAYPDLRRRKAARLSAEPLARGAAQAAVWDEVAAKAGRYGVESPTGAAADIYASHEA